MTVALDVLRDLTQLMADPSLLTALAAAMLTGAVLVAVLALLSVVAPAVPMVSRVSALREKSWGAAFGRQRDPDAAGRPRPRAPAEALAAS